jgi:formylglycine-generating enzyme required for sulfatase activity
VNYSEAEGFCRKLTEQARKLRLLPTGWEFRLPTEAHREYAFRSALACVTNQSGDPTTLVFASLSSIQNRLDKVNQSNHSKEGKHPFAKRNST